MLNNPKRNPGEDLDFKNVSPMGSLSITNKIIMPIVCFKSIFIVYNGNSCVNISPKTFHWGNVWNFLERYPFGDSSFPPILAIFIVVVENYRDGYVFRGALTPPPLPMMSAVPTQDSWSVSSASGSGLCPNFPNSPVPFTIMLHPYHLNTISSMPTPSLFLFCLVFINIISLTLTVQKHLQCL